MSVTLADVKEKWDVNMVKATRDAFLSLAKDNQEHITILSRDMHGLDEWTGDAGQASKNAINKDITQLVTQRNYATNIARAFDQAIKDIQDIKKALLEYLDLAGNFNIYIALEDGKISTLPNLRDSKNSRLAWDTIIEGIPDLLLRANNIDDELADAIKLADGENSTQRKPLFSADDSLKPTSDPYNLGPDFAKNFDPHCVPSKYRQAIIDAAYQYGIPPEILAAQIEQESSWNPTVRAGDYDQTGSVGLSQATTITWNWSPFGRDFPVTPQNQGTANDPRNNPELAIKFLAWLDRYTYKSYPDSRLMLDGYNGGASSLGVRNGISNNYVPSILRRISKFQKDHSGRLPFTPDIS